MSPEKARVIYAEDDSAFHALVKTVLELGGHEVVYSAYDVDTALQGIREVEQRGIQVAVFDGNLGPSRDCQDGRILSQSLRESHPNIPIIGLSGSIDADYGDIQVRKGDIFSLSKLIDRL